MIAGSCSKTTTRACGAQQPAPEGDDVLPARLHEHRVPRPPHPPHQDSSRLRVEETGDHAAGSRYESLGTVYSLLSSEHFLPLLTPISGQIVFKTQSNVWCIKNGNFLKWSYLPKQLLSKKKVVCRKQLLMIEMFLLQVGQRLSLAFLRTI